MIFIENFEMILMNLCCCEFQKKNFCKKKVYHDLCWTVPSLDGIHLQIRDKNIIHTFTIVKDT